MLIIYTMFNCEMLQKSIEDKLTGAKVEVWDTRNDGNHFQAKVVYSGFEGKTLIEQHKMVYAALKTEMDAGLHSISIKTKVE